MAHSTPKQKIDIVKRICEKYSTGELTIASCVENEGISERTFGMWLEENSELADAYKEAKEKARLAQRGQLKQACMTSLMKLIQGYEVEEIHQDGVPILNEQGEQVAFRTKSVKRIKKHYQANVTAVIFALKALDPSMYRDNTPEVQQNQEQLFLIGGKEVRF